MQSKLQQIAVPKLHLPESIQVPDDRRPCQHCDRSEMQAQHEQKENGNKVPDQNVVQNMKVWVQDAAPVVHS
ncbi:hypothetical protein QE152_g20733 [Popillia japonica]|uniref:Uncharacterized protein n=1 Tax=Popillia japonica TaxID=7064 RepID=A0AAW1KNU0_POPJA